MSSRTRAVIALLASSGMGFNAPAAAKTAVAMRAPRWFSPPVPRGDEQDARCG